MATSVEDKHAGTKRWITRFCRAFKPEHVDWTSASEPTEGYNCMGFVMGIVPKTGNLESWQAPDVVNGVRMNPTHYWPDGVAPGDDIAAFRLAAESAGFAPCPSPDPEPGYITIVLFYDQKRGDTPLYFLVFCCEV